MHHVFNTELHLETPTCFDALMHHHHHQGVLLTYQSYTPVNIEPVSPHTMCWRRAYPFQALLIAYCYQVVTICFQHVKCVY